MAERRREIASFLAEAGLEQAVAHPLAGDASARRYYRVTDGAGRPAAVLMDAEAEGRERFQLFITLAKFLLDAGFSAPRILASDADSGLMLLEDLGDDLVARIAVEPGMERSAYLAAADLLAELQRVPPPADLPRDTPAEMAARIEPVFRWYAGGDASAGAITEELRDSLSRARVAPRVFVHRDFHAENLLWLPARAGVARIGILDFQDARIGSPAYDLASLIGDARRDVRPELASAVTDRHIRATGADADALALELAAVGAQRNLRILGVFARLAAQHAKPHYLTLLPRVWRNLMRDLEHPQLARLRNLVTAAVEPPDADTTNRIMAR